MNNAVSVELRQAEQLADELCRILNPNPLRPGDLDRERAYALARNVHHMICEAGSAYGRALGDDAIARMKAEGIIPTNS